MYHVTVTHRQAEHFKIPLLSEACPCTLMLPDNEKACCRHLSSIIFKCQDVGGNSVKEPAVVGYHHHRSCTPFMPLAFKPHPDIRFILKWAQAVNRNATCAPHYLQSC